MMNHKGLNQLLCAAVVNERFREVLLHHPERAIASGYGNQCFALTVEEQKLVIGIQADRLEDFAAEIYGWISGNGREATLRAPSLPSGNGRMLAMSYSEPVADLSRVAAAA
jgi:hypothetical protein